MTEQQIIRPDGSDVKDLMDAGNPEDGEQLTRQQRRFKERQGQKDTEKAKKVLGRVARMRHIFSLLNSLQSLSDSMSETDISFVALVGLLEEKGLVTKEEVMEKEQEIFDRLNRQKNTPNSPALDEAREASEDGDAERLDEPEVVTTEDEESTSQRIVEG